MPVATAHPIAVALFASLEAGAFTAQPAQTAVVDCDSSAVPQKVRYFAFGNFSNFFVVVLAARERNATHRTTRRHGDGEQENHKYQRRDRAASRTTLDGGGFGC
jgi:hypothetical protein